MKELSGEELYPIRNFITTFGWKILRRNERQILSLNKKLKNTHKGERCFIIGNGPSLKKQNLSLLANEFTITVNRQVLSDSYIEINTNVHIWSDMDFFSEELFEKGNMLKMLQNINSDINKPICLFPVQAKVYIEKYQLDQILKVHYFRQGGFLYSNYKKEINLCELIPNGSTVVLVAIMTAIYMGFTEINLLGCDCTSAKGYIDGYTKRKNSEYAFDIPEEQNKIVSSNTLYKRSTEYAFKLFYHTFRDYRIIYDFCKYKKIEIYNCTEGGILDTFPQKSLKEAIEGQL